MSFSRPTDRPAARPTTVLVAVGFVAACLVSGFFSGRAAAGLVNDGFNLTDVALLVVGALIVAVARRAVIAKRVSAA